MAGKEGIMAEGCSRPLDFRGELMEALPFGETMVKVVDRTKDVKPLNEKQQKNRKVLEILNNMTRQTQRRCRAKGVLDRNLAIKKQKLSP